MSFGASSSDLNLPGGNQFLEGDETIDHSRNLPATVRQATKSVTDTSPAVMRRDIGLITPSENDIEPYGLLKEDSTLFQNNLQIADVFINRTYMPALRTAEVTPPSERAIGIRNALRLAPITKFVYDEEEDINDKLMNVYTSLHNDGSSIVLILCGTEKEVTVYLGSMNQGASSSDALLQQSFSGNFPGSTFGQKLQYADIEVLLSKATSSDVQEIPLNVACVTAVPTPRTDGTDTKYQYLDQFVDTMRGKEYVAMLIATPVNTEMLEKRIAGFEQLYSELSPYAEQSFAHQVSRNETVSTGTSNSFSRNVSKAVSESTGISVGHSTTESSSLTLSHSTTSGWSQTSTASGQGGGSSITSNHSETDGISHTQGTSYSKQITKSKNTGVIETVGDGTGVTTSSGLSTGSGTSRTITITRTNKKVQELLEQTEQQIHRLRESKVFGVWECAAYFIAEKMLDATNAANAFRALLMGDKSTSEQSYITVWESNKSRTHTQGVLSHLRLADHPTFNVNMRGDTVQFREQVRPTSLLSGKELPLFLSMPRFSVNGLPVVQMASFGRSITKIDPVRHTQGGRDFPIGHIYHRGITETESVVSLDADNLTSHVFVTGSTGSGKSNTTYRLLESLYAQHHIPFLVIEPAKGEYKSQFANLEGINIFTTQDTVNRLLRINPFAFPDGIHILEHLDRLLEIFKACWEMTAAMPALLKKSLETIYCKAGWDLTASVNVLSPDKPIFPTFRSLLTTLREVIELSDYSAEIKGNYKGSLVSRVESLTNGIIGQVFCSGVSDTDTELFDEPAVVDLSRVGAAETKALIMGILVMRLNEHRVVCATDMNSRLRHITVLEEAHNLLPRINGGDSSGGANLQAKSVEMLSNSIAEMRTYGEGFLIVDQSPSAVSETAIRNTNTKIVMRLPDAEDARTVGLSIGLNENQIREIAKFPQGVAAIKQSSWVESVLVKIDAAGNPYKGTPQIVSAEAACHLRADLWKYLCHAVSQRNYADEHMQHLIAASSLPSDKKKDLLMLLPAIRKSYEQQLTQSTARKQNNLRIHTLRLLGLDNLLSVFEFDLAERAALFPPSGIDINAALQSMGKAKVDLLLRISRSWISNVRNALATYLDVETLDKQELGLLLKWLIVGRLPAVAGTPLERCYVCLQNLLHHSPS